MLLTLHHAISPVSELHINNLLYLLYYEIQNWGKKIYPIFVFESVVGKFTPRWHGLASMRAANREKPLAHKLRSFKSSLCTCPASSASIECIFSVYRLVWPNIRKSFYAEMAEKLIKIYRFYRAEEDNQQNLLILFELFLTFFQVLKNSLLFVCFITKNYS